MSLILISSPSEPRILLSEESFSILCSVIKLSIINGPTALLIELNLVAKVGILIASASLWKFLNDLRTLYSILGSLDFIPSINCSLVSSSSLRELFSSMLRSLSIFFILSSTTLLKEVNPVMFSLLN